MIDKNDFKKRMKRMERKGFLVERIAIGIIITVIILIIVGSVINGILTYKFISDPESIGNWFNRLLSGIKAGDE